MKKLITICLVAVVLLVGGAAKAAITIDTVPVGNAGNIADTLIMWTDGTTGYGKVSYNYNIGKYEVTAGQYTAFLNAKAATDTYALYNDSMSSDTWGCKIIRTGSPGSYSYSVASDYANRPVNFVSWYDAIRFANWMTNGQGNGDTESGSYSIFLGGADSGYVTIPDHANGTPGMWFLASENEWYKAAYHKNDDVTGNYWLYATRSNIAPGRDMADPFGNNINRRGNGIPFPIDSGTYYTTVVGEFQNSASAYGTFDQTGNVNEWNEDITYSNYRILRGGSFLDETDNRYVQALYRNSARPEFNYTNVGFRVSKSCPSADLTGDCFVDMKDFALFASQWLRDDCVTPDWCGGADFDKSGKVGMEDLAELMAQWL